MQNSTRAGYYPWQSLTFPVFKGCMSNRAKNILYSLLLIAAVLIVMRVRSGKKPVPLRLEGKTMGTTYHVTYFDPENRDFQQQVDSILMLVNRSISTWDSLSEISRFNRSASGIALELPYFYPPLQTSKLVYKGSRGAYDPTVMPLVNAWGFGPQKVTRPDTIYIASVRKRVGFDKVRFTPDSLIKTAPGVELDFSAIGQGYGADVVTDFLRSKGIASMLVELGGEGMAVGINLESGKPWELGLVNPMKPMADPVTPQEFFGFLSLKDRGFSTSGNYFNYRLVDGVRYSHTIDPATGYPAEHPIMSASVFAENCALADAWATAFMSMGHVRAIEVLKEHPELEACLIWSIPGGMEHHITPGIAHYIKLEEKGK